MFSSIGFNRSHNLLAYVLTYPLVWVFMYLSQPSWLLAEPVISCPGITEPIKDETLSATVPGTISKLHFREGDVVKKHEVILSLDNKLEALEVSRRKLIWQSEVEVNVAAERVSTAKEDLTGTRQLFESTQSVSRDELMQKELEYKLAVAEWEGLKIVESREEIEYLAALEQLKRREITAPIDGTISKIYLEVGENCEPRQPLIQIVNISECRFITNIEAQATRFLKKDQVVALEIDGAASPILCNGIVSFISPIVDPASGLQEVKVIIDNAHRKISPGVAGRLLIERSVD